MLLNIFKKLDSVSQVNTGLVLLMKSRHNQHKLQETDDNIPQHGLQSKSFQSKTTILQNIY